jgi:hypothetical protein
MQQTKLVAAIVIVAGLMIWPVGWQLYTYLPELKQFSPTEYTNYLIISILGFYVASAIVYKNFTQQPPQKPQPHQKQQTRHNPGPATANIDQLTVDVAFLKEELKQVKSTVSGLQVFFKSEKKEEATKE